MYMKRRIVATIMLVFTLAVALAAKKGALVWRLVTRRRTGRGDTGHGARGHHPVFCRPAATPETVHRMR